MNPRRPNRVCDHAVKNINDLTQHNYCQGFVGVKRRADKLER